MGNTEIAPDSTVINALNNLDVLWLPSFLTTIEEEAFANLACQAIIIPDSCTSIGDRAFADCTHLLYVRIPESVKSYPGNAFEGCGQVCIDWDSTEPVLKITTDAYSYDYADSVELVAEIVFPDGSTEGIEEIYQDAYIEATLLTSDGEVVPGFITQATYDVRMVAHFPLAADDMEPGYYRIEVNTSIDGLYGQSAAFYYTADKSNLPDPSTCRIELTLNTDSFGLNELFKITATVKDKDGNPAKGVKVGFAVLDHDRNLSGFYYPSDWLWNITRNDGTCAIGSVRSQYTDEFPAGNYIACIFIVDTEIVAEKQFEFTAN